MSENREALPLEENPSEILNQLAVTDMLKKVLQGLGEISCTVRDWSICEDLIQTGVSEGMLIEKLPSGRHGLIARIRPTGQVSAQNLVALVQNLVQTRLESFKYEEQCEELARRLRCYEKEEVDIEQTLQKAWRKAEEATSDRGLFLSSITEEIRTPLSGVVSMSRLLNETRLNPTQKEYVDILLSSADGLTQLINDLQDFSRVQSGDLELENVSFNLEHVLDQIRRQQGYLARQKGLEFRVTRDPSVPSRLKGDALRLRQMMLNLTSNAIKFTEEGEVELVISAACDSGTKSCNVVIEVRDSGQGIPEDVQETYLKAFRANDLNEARTIGRFGLGLTMTKGLCNLFGGRIYLQSVENVGSAFTVQIPVEWPEPEAKHESAEIPLDLRVLVAEDSRVNQTVLKHLFKRLGLQTTMVSNGKEVLDSTLQNEYDVIFMDLWMPEMDGHVAASRIRERPDVRFSSARLPIVALTADTSSGVREQCLKAGMNDYLSKPITLEALQDVLRGFRAA